MTVEQRWNERDRGKPKYSQKTPWPGTTLLDCTEVLMLLACFRLLLLFCFLWILGQRCQTVLLLLWHYRPIQQDHYRRHFMIQSYNNRRYKFSMTKQRGCHMIFLWVNFDVHKAAHRNIISIVKPTRCTKVLFYFGITLYMFRTVYPSIIRSSRLYIQLQAFVKQILLYVQSWTLDDGQKDRPKHVECNSKIK